MTARPPVRVLTISATYGSGGALVAPLLARRLGMPFADRVLNPLGPTRTRSEEQVTAEELDEQPRSPLLDGLALLGATWSLPVTRGVQDLPERLRTEIET